MKINELIIFAAGAAIGSVLTWKLVKTKYERIAQEEIDSVKDIYSSRKPKEDEKENEEKEDTWVDEAIDTLNDVLDKAGYNKQSEEKEDEDETNPYPIGAEEYFEEEYETVTLWYHNNGIFTDDLNGELNDDQIEEMIGDAVKNVEECEEDSIIIRNDDLETDYEIIITHSAWEG